MSSAFCVNFISFLVSCSGACEKTKCMGKFFLQKFTDPGPVSNRNLLVLKNCLLVLNIGMKETKFVKHKINLLATE